MLPSKEERIRRSADVLARLLQEEIAVIRDCEENLGLDESELAAKSLVELVVEDLGVGKSNLFEYYHKELSPYGVRMLKASFNQLDRVTGTFYERTPEGAVLYCARIKADIDEIIEHEIDGLNTFEIGSKTLPIP